MARDPATGMDPGMASILSQITSAGSGSGSGPTTGVADPSNLGQLGLTLSDLQALLAGTARQSLTTRPFVGSMPSWVPPELKTFVRQGVIDPYLGTGQDASVYRVYMGRTKPRPGTKDQTTWQWDMDGNHKTPVTTPGKAAAKAGDKTMTIAQAMNAPFLWGEDQVSAAIKRFQAAGLYDVKDFDSLAKAWGGLVQRAGATYSLSSGKKKVTPWDVLDLYKNEMTKAGTLPPDPNRTTTQVARSVSDISEGDAFASLQSTLSQMLGHDPSDQELRDFTYRMNSLAAHNPSITKTITQYKNGEVASQNSHTSGGFTANDVAEQAYQRAQDDPDYAEYQSATTYFNAALSTLGPIGG